jgi:hypothetical protein
MGTTYKTIRKFIRAALLDNDKDRFLYTEEVLDAQIELSNLYLDVNGSHAVGTNSDGDPTGFYINDLTNQQVLILTIKTAIRMLSGVPDNFTYQSPVISVSRRGGVQTLINSLQLLLADVEGEGFAIAIDTDLNALTQGFQRFYNGLAQSASAWSGILTAN